MAKGVKLSKVGNDQRSIVKNPNNVANKLATDNRSVQLQKTINESKLKK